MLAELAARQRERLGERDRALAAALDRRRERAGERTSALAARLDPAFARLLAEAARAQSRARTSLVALSDRLEAAPAQRLQAHASRLEALDRMRQSLGHRETLARGFAVVRGEGGLVTSAAAAARAAGLELEFHDGRVRVAPQAGPHPALAPARSGGAAEPRKPAPDKPEPDQGSLF
jgi:exodeoxyribonuclease VII large subunit